MFLADFCTQYDTLKSLNSADNLIYFQNSNFRVTPKSPLPLECRSVLKSIVGNFVDVDLLQYIVFVLKYSFKIFWKRFIIYNFMVVIDFTRILWIYFTKENNRQFLFS